MGSTPTSRTPRTPSCAAGRRQARGAGLMARTVDLKVKYEVELTVIRPGDTALVRLPRDTTSAQPAEFFGAPARFPVAPWMIAAVLKLPVSPAFGLYQIGRASFREGVCQYV